MKIDTRQSINKTEYLLISVKLKKHILNLFDDQYY